MKMKKPIRIMMLVAAIAIAGVPTQAQSLGGLLKKGKKAVEKIAGETPKKQTASIITESGITVQNPLAEYISIEPVGLYGVANSENFGNLYLVLKVKMNAPVQSAQFGSSIQNQKMIAVDTAGKTYGIDSSGAMRYDTPEGIMVTLRLDNSSLMFENVPRSVGKMQIVKFGVGIDATRQGNITLKNVPVFWDATPDNI